MIGNNTIIVRGPSLWKTDICQYNLNLKRQNINEAPLSMEFSNCRKNNTTRVTEIKKFMCRNRKDPTFYEFLRNTNNYWTESVDQLNQVHIKNKIYLNNTRKQRTNIS